MFRSPAVTLNRLSLLNSLLVLSLITAGIIASDAAVLAQSTATPAHDIHIQEGFKVELVYSVPREQGSWVAMCFDDRGRIYASDQGARLFRVTPPDAKTTDDCNVEVVSDQWGHSQALSKPCLRLVLADSGRARLLGPSNLPLPRQAARRFQLPQRAARISRFAARL